MKKRPPAPKVTDMLAPDGGQVTILHPSRFRRIACIALLLWLAIIAGILAALFS